MLPSLLTALSLLLTLTLALTFPSEEDLELEQHHKHRPRIFFIRHGEEDVHNLPGLSPIGLERSDCLVDVFGPNSTFDIGHIMVPAIRNRDGRHRRSFITATPLATELGLVVDTRCKRDDYRCVAAILRRYKGPGNVLLVWQKDGLRGIPLAMGYKRPPERLHHVFDQIWEYPRTKHGKFKITSECCPRIDDARPSCKHSRSELEEEHIQEDL